ncbi:MAG: VLRF1 family aeRF1-type release factor [Micromonosporaceae bacterium]|jgi:hypothetical protein
MPLSWATLASLAAMADDIGVLSIYVTVDPHHRSESAPRAPWEVRLRNQLTEVERRLRDEGRREHYLALSARLERLRPDLERLLDPTAPGLGRALFTGVSDGEVRTVSLQMPLDDRVVLERDAFIRPLINAWSQAGPAGAVAVGAEGVRLIDLRFGLADEVAAMRPPELPEQPELKGPPAAANPAVPLHAAAQRDLYERREEDKLQRFLRTVGPELDRHARDRAWEHLVVTGDARQVQAVVDGLPQHWKDRVVTLDHPVSTLTVPKIASTVTPALAEARRRHHLDLVRRAHDLALSRGAGAWGLGDTLDALQQGRVDHLLLAVDGQWTGSRTPDGRLVPEGEVPPGVTPDQLTTEPYLGERMIELALGSGAKITAVEPDGDGLLDQAGGVAALLRW